jgi:hypothetical protein
VRKVSLNKQKVDAVPPWLKRINLFWLKQERLHAVIFEEIAA